MSEESASPVKTGNHPFVVVIDNYDSFTFNLVQYFGELGARLEVFRNDQVTVDDLVKLGPDAIVISPGPGTPATSGITLEVIRRLAGRIPILGICLGHQAIGEAFGGRVVRAPQVVHGKTSQVSHDGKTIFEGVGTPFDATRYHSLVVEPDSLPGCLEVSARSADGVVMGLRHRQYLCEGVQFHPEAILTQHGKTMLQNFLNLTETMSAR